MKIGFACQPPLQVLSEPNFLRHLIHLLFFLAVTNYLSGTVIDTRLQLLRVPFVLLLTMTVHDKSTKARVDTKTVVYFVLFQHHLASFNPLLNDLAMHVNEDKAKILRVISAILIQFVLVELLLDRLLYFATVGVGEVGD